MRLLHSPTSSHISRPTQICTSRSCDHTNDRSNSNSPGRCRSPGFPPSLSGLFEKTVTLNEEEIKTAFDYLAGPKGVILRSDLENKIGRLKKSAWPRFADLMTDNEEITFEALCEFLRTNDLGSFNTVASGFKVPRALSSCVYFKLNGVVPPFIPLQSFISQPLASCTSAMWLYRTRFREANALAISKSVSSIFSLTASWPRPCRDSSAMNSALTIYAHSSASSTLTVTASSVSTTTTRCMKCTGQWKGNTMPRTCIAWGRFERGNIHLKCCFGANAECRLLPFLHPHVCPRPIGATRTPTSVPRTSHRPRTSSLQQARPSLQCPMPTTLSPTSSWPLHRAPPLQQPPPLHRPPAAPPTVPTPTPKAVTIRLLRA